MSGAAGRLRVAVIGHGWWGRVHLEAYRRNPPTTLVAVCGRDPDRAADAAAAYGAHPYTDMSRMLEAEHPDLVSVVLPDAAHLGPTLRVLEAGIACFAEKPLARDIEEAETLLTAARRREVRFGINFNHRYSTPFQRTKQYIEARRRGAPAHFPWKFTGGHFPERQPPLHHLLSMQSHGFDMLGWLAGPVGTLIASVDGNYADTHNHEFECLGLGGRIRVTDVLRRFEWCPRGDREGVVVWEPGFFDDRERDFAATTATHIDRFVAAQLAGEPVPVPAEGGHRALRLGLAAIESARTARPAAVQTL